MLAKKLFTLACATGILAWGACFLPPLPIRRPPPPRLDFQGIEVIQVEGTNLSPMHFVDPAELAVSVTKSLNARKNTTGVAAHIPLEGAYHDAVLQITVLGESANPLSTPSSSGTANWTWMVRVAGTLTRRDGVVVWRRTDLLEEVHHPFRGGDETSVRKDPILMNWLSSELGAKIAHEILYGS